MSTATILVLRCDRCGYEVTAERDAKPERGGWGRAGAEQVDGKMRIGTPEGGADDLCPGCTEALFAWWREPTGPVEQPRPLVPPPPPVLTIEDRRAAIATVVEALRVRTHLVMEIIRQEPTQILSGDVVPGVLIGIEDSAAGMVDAVLDVFRVPVPGHRS